MAAVACSHSLSKRLKLTLLQQGGMLRTPDLVELRNLTLLQQGGTSPTFEVVYLTSLQQGGAFRAPGLVKRNNLTLLQQGDPVFSTGTGEAMIFTLLQQGGRPKPMARVNASTSPCCNKVLKVDSVNRAIQWLKSTRTDSKRAQS